MLNELRSVTLINLEYFYFILFYFKLNYLFIYLFFAFWICRGLKKKKKKNLNNVKHFLWSRETSPIEWKSFLKRDIFNRPSQINFLIIATSFFIPFFFTNQLLIAVDPFFFVDDRSLYFFFNNILFKPITFTNNFSCIFRIWGVFYNH